MKLNAFAYLHASSSYSSDGSILDPYAMFSLIVPENNNGSY
jgi:hypothetical protein